MERPNIFEALEAAEPDAHLLDLYAPLTAGRTTAESENDSTSETECRPPSGSDSPVSSSLAESEEDESSTPERASGTFLKMTAVDGTEWDKVRLTTPGRTSSRNVFKKPPTQIPATQNVHNPIDAYKLFVSDNMLDNVVKYTNLYAHSMDPKWADCDRREMEGLVGALLYIGVQKQNMLSTTDLWDQVDGVTLLKCAMSRDRFKSLLVNIRFDDKTSRSARRARDPLAPFREMWDDFGENLKRYYIPGPFLTIDEQLVPFRGRCSFLQYLPSKPDRYGLKVFWVADAENNFPLVGIPYLGRPVGQARQVNLGRNVAMELCTPYFKSGRNVTCDNYFTDLTLAETCLKNGLTVIGTVRTNKRFLPLPFKSNKSLPMHGSQFAFKESTTLVNYQSKRNKNTVLLSTMHDKAEVDESTPQKKSEIVLFYNSTKGAVDALDKLAHCCTSKRRTHRWPLVMFSNVLDLATVASRIVFSIKYPDHRLSGKQTRADFIRCVSKQMMLASLESRCQNVFLPRELSIATRLAYQDIHKTCGTADVPGTSVRGGRGRTSTQTSGVPGTSVQGGRGQTSVQGGRGRTSTQTSGVPGTSMQGGRGRTNTKMSGLEEEMRGQNKRPADSGPEIERNAPRKRMRCGFCQWKKDKKNTDQCVKCEAFICVDHCLKVCHFCFNKH